MLSRILAYVYLSWWTVLFGLIYGGLFLHSASTGSVVTSVGSHLILYVPLAKRTRLLS